MSRISDAIFLALVTFHVLAGLTVAQTVSPSSNSDHSTVRLSLTVTNDDGEAISGLKQDYFTIYDNKASQKLVYFSDEDIPTSVGILLDLSGSMLGPLDIARKKLTTIKQALASFVKENNPSNEYFIVGFNEHAELLQDWTNDGNTILGRLNDVQLKGNTAFYDACFLAIDKIKQAHFSKRALIVISDGNDNESSHKSTDIKNLVRGSDFPFYSVNLVPAAPPGSSRDVFFDNRGEDNLMEFDRMSGGMSFLPNDGDAKSVFETIARALRHTYVLGFSPASSGKHQWHSIDVKLSLPLGHPERKRHLTVRSRQGYYETASRD